MSSGLVLCAGIDGAPEMRTKQGNELHMSVNHLGHMLLAAELMPTLRGATPAPARVVSITSSAALDAMVALLHAHDVAQKLGATACLLPIVRRVRRAHEP